MAISTPFGTTFSTIGVGASGQVVPGGTFVDFGGLRSGTVSITHNEIDTTNNDGAGFTSFIPGNTSLEVTAEMVYDPTDSAQSTIRGAGAEAGGGNFKAAYAWRVRPLGAGSVEEYSFEGYITSFELNPGENDGVSTLSITIKASGAPTFDADQS